MEQEVSEFLQKKLKQAVEVSRPEIQNLCKEYLQIVGSGKYAINGFSNHRRLSTIWKNIVNQLQPKIVIHKSQTRVYLIIEFADPLKLDQLTPVTIKRNMQGEKYHVTGAKYTKGGWWRYFEFGTSGTRNFESEEWGYIHSKNGRGGFMARVGKPTFLHPNNILDKEKDNKGTKRIFPRPHPGVRKHAMFRSSWLYWKPIFLKKIKEIIQANFNKVLTKDV